MKKLFPAVLSCLLLCAALASCSAGAAGGGPGQDFTGVSTQPYIETSGDAQSSPEQPSSGEAGDTEASQAQSETSDSITGAEDTTLSPTVPPATIPAQPDTKPAAVKPPDATEKPTQKPPVKPAETTTQAPTPAPTKAPETQPPTTQEPTQQPTLVPEGNYILMSISGYEKKEVLKATVMEFSDGDSVFDLIKKVTRDNKIQMEFKGSGMTAYIMGIDNVYEFDHGAQSGWMYKVNGEFPDVSCGRYKVNQGDIVEFVYSVNMGKDRREG